MQSILLTFASICLCLTMGYSQTCQSDLTPQGLFDDFSVIPGNGNSLDELQWLPEDTPGQNITMARSNGSFELDVTQPDGHYGTLNLFFGFDQFDNPKTINLSQDASFSMDITNNDLDSLIQVYLTLVDENGNTIDGFAEALNDNMGNWWKYIIREFPIQPQEKVTFSGTFDNGVHINWGNGTLDQQFDFTRVQYLSFIIVNGHENPVNAFAPFPLTNTSVTIDNLRLGACELFPSSMLKPSSCNQELREMDLVEAVLVNEATGYQFRFTDLTTGDEYTAISNASGTVQIGHDVDLPSFVDYSADVRVIIGQDTGAFTSSCIVYTNCVTGEPAPGFYSDFVFDDCNSPLLYGGLNGEVLSWGELALGSEYDITRTTNGMYVNITEPTRFMPMVLDFGKNNADSAHTVDLSEHTHFSMTLTNLSSDSTISVFLSFVDEEGDQILLDANAQGQPFNDFWMYRFEEVLSPGETKTITGSIDGGFGVDFENSVYEQECNTSRIAEVWVTVIHEDGSAGLVNLPIKISEFWMGNSCQDNPILSNSEVQVSSQQVSVYPNPFEESISIAGMKNGHFVLTDLAGDVLKRGSFSENQNIDLAGHSLKGAFILKLTDAYGVTSAQMIVKE